MTSLLGKMFRLKLKLLREKLQVWNRDSFGKVEVRLQSLLKEIHLIDEEESSALLEEDRAAYQLLKEEYERVLCMEEMLWKQKSRV